MKTDDLIGLLSNQVTRIERGAVARRFTKALLLGALGSLILMSVVFGVRHDLGSVARTTIFWAKMAYPRLPIVLGHTWRTCPFNIVLLSVPTFPAVFWAVKSLAPTQLRLAGAVAGLLASSTATIVYCLHCPEMSPAFWSVWYAIGMLLPAGIGAWLGPKLLRW